MKTVIVTVLACLLCNMAQAGFEWGIVPTLDGGMFVLSFDRNPKIECADPVGADDDGLVLTHLKNNWGKYTTLLAAIGSYLMVADNNDIWPFSNREADSGAGGVSGAGAAAPAGGTVVYVSGNNNNVAIGDGNFTETRTDGD